MHPCVLMGLLYLAPVSTLSPLILSLTPPRLPASPKSVCPAHNNNQGAQCRHVCSTDGVIRAAVMWNAPIHSWTGVASEAVDFLVPLARRLPELALVGGCQWVACCISQVKMKLRRPSASLFSFLFSNAFLAGGYVADYVSDLPLLDQARLATIRVRMFGAE
jgi:hypothetical protein